MRGFLKSGMFALLLGTGLMAAAPAEAPRTVVATLSANPDKCVIYGTALDVNAAPLPAAPVRLRNLQTRTIEQRSATNAAGEFVFVASPDTPYVVEVVDRPGRVVAVGDVIHTRAGELAGSMIVVVPPLQSAGLFRPAMGTVLSAIGGLGLTVLQPAPPLSPEK